MREIKFRVWHPTFGMMKSQDIFQMTSFKFDNGDGTKTLEKYYEPDVTFMQFTGLKDKNGKEIYEGDIVETPTTKKMVIGWSEGKASFVIRRDGWAFEHFFKEAMEAEDCNVVGNIYENPELISNLK